MAFPVIQYNAASGSDTAASGAGPTTAVTGTNGDLSATTLTLNETKDFTGVADDGSDALWYEGAAGDRHLFQITAFNPSVGACTSLTLAVSGTTRTGLNWAVGGIRKTFENDSTRPDWDDVRNGWAQELDEGTYTLTQAFQVNTGALATNTGPGYILRAKAGAATKPIIHQTANANVFQPFTQQVTFVVKGIKFTVDNGIGLGTQAYISSGVNMSLVMVDCVLDMSGPAIPAGQCVFMSAVSGTFTAIGCYFTGSSGWGVSGAGDGGIVLLGCTFDGQSGTYFGNAAVNCASGPTGRTIASCLIIGLAGDGLKVIGDAGNSTLIKNNTIFDCGGNGITVDPGDAHRTHTVIANNILSENGGYGISYADANAGPYHLAFCDYNGFYSNTSGEQNANAPAGDNDVTLTADPFNDSAGGDFSLNTVAGGGAALLGVGYPSTFPDGT